MANGIRPDVIAGTSIGAVAGGLYAMDRLDEFEAWARALTRRRIFGYLDFSFSGSGLISGSRLAGSPRGKNRGGPNGDPPPKLAPVAPPIRTGRPKWVT